MHFFQRNVELVLFDDPHPGRMRPVPRPCPVQWNAVEQSSMCICSRWHPRDVNEHWQQSALHRHHQQWLIRPCIVFFSWQYKIFSVQEVANVSRCIYFFQQQWTTKLTNIYKQERAVLTLYQIKTNLAANFLPQQKVQDDQYSDQLQHRSYLWLCWKKNSQQIMVAAMTVTTSISSLLFSRICTFLCSNKELRAAWTCCLLMLEKSMFHQVTWAAVYNSPQV